jgi:TonB family protein
MNLNMLNVNTVTMNLRLRAAKLRLLTIALLLILLPIAVQPADVLQNRKALIHQMAQDFSRLGLRKLYLPDSCDSSSHPNGVSSFYAFIFSGMLETDKKGFAVLDRAEAHRFLLKNQWTDCDLMKPEVLAKFAAGLGVDSLLFVVTSSNSNSFSVDFSFRDISGKELLRSSYKEPFEAFNLGFLPPVAAPSGWPFYFAGEGITMPKAVRMQNPPYPGKPQNKHISGTVVISAVVRADGKIDQARIVQKVDPDLDKAALEGTRAWLFEPAKAPDGTRVPVRVPFEINFRMY